ncbi:MAG: aldehyde dehydrogenase family protein [Parvibaculales bacterium]
MSHKSQYGHFIDGVFSDPSGYDCIDSINPCDQSVNTRIAKGTAFDVEAAVRAARGAYDAWSQMRPLERGKILISVGRALEAEAERFAKLESMEMGQPVAAALGPILGAANYFQYYGGLAPSIHGDAIQVGPAQHSYTTHEPYGVVGVITPWNLPLNQAARSSAPALAAGNTVVHKPSEITSVTALEFAELAVKAGLPEGVYNVITGFGADIGPALVTSPHVAKVAFTGSVATGQAIAGIAADKIMPVTLELGGKSPSIVFEDADLDRVLPAIVNGCLGNSGQVCLAGTRILVQRAIYDEVSAKLTAAFAAMPVGVENELPTLGPIANVMQYSKVLDYFEIAKQDGATLLTGGGKATGPGLETGFYIQPTLYGDVSNDMRIAQEEIFGPVGVLIPFDDEADAVQIANDIQYGLAAGIFTENLGRAHRVAAQVQAGQIYVNAYLEPSVEHPLGGYKKSGIGREKGMMALKQYTQVKNVIMTLG